jgi:hypothetical protein
MTQVCEGKLGLLIVQSQYLLKYTAEIDTGWLNDWASYRTAVDWLIGY